MTHQRNLRITLAAIMTLLLLSVCVMASAAGFSDSPSLIEEATDSVVKLTVYDRSGNGFATGSGFFLFDDRTIVTNYHVIDEGWYVRAETDDGVILDVASVLVCSKSKDLAILRLERSSGQKALPYSTEKVLRGTAVVAIGSPSGFKNQVSKGVLSGTESENNVSYVMFNAPISSGSSGGALFNDDG